MKDLENIIKGFGLLPVVTKNEDIFAIFGEDKETLFKIAANQLWRISYQQTSMKGVEFIVLDQLTEDAQTYISLIISDLEPNQIPFPEVLQFNKCNQTLALLEHHFPEYKNSGFKFGRI